MFEDSNNMDDELPLGKRITLRRLPIPTKVTNSNDINVNLKSLEKNMHSKKLAQQLYYENKGTSPLLRDAINDNKLPVHERLGSVTRKRIAYNFNPNIRNKKKQKRKNNNGVNMKKNLAQERLQRIRQQRMADHMLNNSAYPPRFRLRRNLQSNPVNYKILINNELACKNFGLPQVHSLHGSLTNHLQDEIKILQLQNIVEPQVIPNTSIASTGYGYTGISTNNRFTLLP